MLIQLLKNDKLKTEELSSVFSYFTYVIHFQNSKQLPFVFCINVPTASNPALLYTLIALLLNVATDSVI